MQKNMDLQFNINTHPKIKILVGYHKPAVLLKDEILTPIHLGRALATQESKDGEMSKEDYEWMCENMIGDDTGENISHLNRYFCELTGIYWAYKNYDKLGNPDYIGFMHYRRHFILTKELAHTENAKYFEYFDKEYLRDIELNQEKIYEIIKDTDIIYTTPHRRTKTVLKQFESDLTDTDFDLDPKIWKESIKLLKQKYPQDLQYINKYLNQNDHIWFNMFIMRKDIFFEYCKWLFDIMFELYEHFKADLSKYSIKGQRVLAFISERFTAIFIYKNLYQFTTKKFEISLVENTKIITPIKPCFKEYARAIVLFANDKNATYIGVTLQSLIENTNQDEKIDIIIFSQISYLRYQKMLNDLSTDKISVRLFDLKNIVKIDHLSTLKYDDNFIKPTMKNYKKIICLDENLIINGNFFENHKNILIWFSSDIVRFDDLNTSDLKIISYKNQDKPWISLGCKHADIWWKYAKNTPFYEILFYEFALQNNKNISKIPNIFFRNNGVFLQNVSNQAERNLNLVYVCDKNSVKKCAVSMFSALKNKDEKDFIKFYFIYDESFVDTDLEVFKIFNTSNSSMTLLKVNSKDFKLYRQTTLRKEMPINAYYRLEIPWLLLNEEKAIYIDYDTAVMTSLWQMYELNLSNYYLAAVDDAWKYGRYRQMMHIQPQSRHYNSGMMLINCKKWRDENMKKKFINFAKRYKEVFVLADQFFINAVINKNIIYLNLSWNLQLNRIELGEILEFDDENELKQASNNPKIIHYNFGKPWQIPTCLNPYFSLWWQHARELPFYQDILKQCVKESLKIQVPVLNKQNFGAVERVKNQLSYKLGNIIIKDFKSPQRLFILPYELIKTVKEHRIYLKNNQSSLPLSQYADYEEALKVKQYLSYRLGNALLKNPFTFIFKVPKIFKQFKADKKAGFKNIHTNAQQNKLFSLKEDEEFLMKLHQDIFKTKPDFKSPKTFSQKIAHRYLYDRSPIYTALADKLKVRLYVNAKCKDGFSRQEFFGENSPLFKDIDDLNEEIFATNECKYLPKLYAIYKNVYDIDFQSLPDSFVLKTNNDSGGVVIVENKKEFLKDTKKFSQGMQKLSEHLKRNYYFVFREWQYFHIKPRVFAEELLIGDNGKPADTYKFHIFSQTDRAHNFIQVTTDRFDDYQRAMLDSEWNLAPFGITYDNSKLAKMPKKPMAFEAMYDLSLKLASEFDYVRVDLYQNGDKIYFGELTFTPGAGTERIVPDEWDFNLGNLWDLKRLVDESK